MGSTWDEHGMETGTVVNQHGLTWEDHGINMGLTWDDDRHSGESTWV